VNVLFAEYLIDKTVHERHEAAVYQDCLLIAKATRSSSARRGSVPGAAHIRRLGRMFQALGGSDASVVAKAEGARP
jgi:hypothetical protein